MYRAFWQLISRNPNFPEYLVLEYGIDHSGDMDYLLSIAKPDIAVITAISPAHLEYMGSLAVLAREKGKLVTSLSSACLAVLNADDNLVSAFKSQTKAKVITFGLTAGAQVRADSVGLSYDSDNKPQGTTFKLISGGSSVPILLKEIVGKPSVLVSLGAAAVGTSLGISPLDIGQALQAVVWAPGRLRLLSGIKNTILIDDTYNSSPQALTEALNVLANIKASSNQRSWAVLGDMLELGVESSSLHEQAGRQLAELGVDCLVTIGEQSRILAQGALTAGFNKDQVWHFAKSEEAGRFIQEKLMQGDIVLIKGSQGIRCEKITKELMAEPLRAGELLVRQYKPWI
jgi:UDP-N-acetylmuramoyl-tripeptide--D-alanyl-D-alanine ligase